MTPIKEHEVQYNCIAKGESVGAERVSRQLFHEKFEEQPRGWQDDPNLGTVANMSLLCDE
jgi:hypothetical protein